MNAAQWLQDVRYGLRAMRRSPLFAVVVVLSLGLGIGANTAILTVLNAALWAPLPVPAPERLVQIRTVESTGRERGIPLGLLEHLRGDRRVFAGVAGVSARDGVALRVGGRTERAVAEAVTSNYFSVLGVRPFLGRFLMDGEDGAAWRPVVVVSYDFFERRFQGDPAIVGSTLHLNGYPFTVVGVSPPGFFGFEVGTSPELRIPMMREAGMAARLLPAMQQLLAVGRLADVAFARLGQDVTREVAQAATEVVLQQLAMGQEAAERDLHVRLLDGSRGRTGLGGLQRPLLIVLAVASLVLVIACANVAHLLLARAAARQHEMATRVALGAGRGRLVRQLLTESLLLAAAGGLLGVVLAGWGADGLRALLLPPASVTPYLELASDRRILAFAAALSLGTALAFGMAPALQASRADGAAALKPDARTVAGRGTLGQALVVAEVALTVVLITAAGLFLRSLSNLAADDPTDAERTLLFSMKPVRDGDVFYPDGNLPTLYRELAERVQGLPGVGAVGIVTSNDRPPVPGLRGAAAPHQAEILKEDDTRVTVDLRVAEGVSSTFFQMFRIAPLAGRTLGDDDDGRPVLVVSEALAADLFGSENPIGRKIRVNWKRFDAEQWEIVGVVSSAHHAFPGLPAARFCYIPFGSDRSSRITTLIVRTRAAGHEMTGPVLSAIHALDPELPVFNIRSIATELERERRRERLVAALASAFGGLAVLLAAIGVYGVIAYAVTRRTREIGIRVALGARRSAVVGMVLGDTLRLVLLGLVVGLPLAYAGARLVAGELYGLAPHDPWVAAGSLLLVALAGLLAGALPAWRAAHLEPLDALRHD